MCGGSVCDGGKEEGGLRYFGTRTKALAGLLVPEVLVPLLVFSDPGGIRTIACLFQRSCRATIPAGQAVHGLVDPSASVWCFENNRVPHQKPSA